jgi:hypothetical protein
LSSVLETLDREWATLAPSRTARRCLRRWAHDHPVFDGLDDLDALLERRRAPGASGPILSALAALAPADEVAARTLLQALIPGLVYVYQAVGAGDPTVLNDVLANAWMTIRTYPAHREGSVAANVLWDARKRYRRDHRKYEALRDVPPVAWRREHAPSAEEVALDNLGLGLLIDRLRRANVDDEMLRTLLRHWLGEEPMTALSAEIGVPRHTLNMRRYRTELRLRHLPLAG